MVLLQVENVINTYLVNLMRFFISTTGRLRANVRVAWICGVILFMISLSKVHTASAGKSSFEAFFPGALPCKMTTYSKPASVLIDECVKATCVDVKDSYRVCKCVTEEYLDFGFILYRNKTRIGKWPASAFMGDDSDYEVISHDLDLNGTDELIVANRAGTSNGMAVNYWQLFVLKMADTYIPPLVLSVDDYGQGSFIALSKSNKCDILATEWSEAKNSKGKVGLYYNGRLVKYKDGVIEPMADAPVFSRRYLGSFEKERNNDVNESYEGLPIKWLNSSKTEARMVDPFFDMLTLVNTIEANIANISVDKGSRLKESIWILELTIDSGEKYKYMLYLAQDKSVDSNGIDRVGMQKSGKLYPPGYYPVDKLKESINKKIQISKYKNEYGEYFNVLWLE